MSKNYDPQKAARKIAVKHPEVARQLLDCFKQMKGPKGWTVGQLTKVMTEVGFLNLLDYRPPYGSTSEELQAFRNELQTTVSATAETAGETMRETPNEVPADIPVILPPASAPAIMQSTATTPVEPAAPPAVEDEDPEWLRKAKAEEALTPATLPAAPAPAPAARPPVRPRALKHGYADTTEAPAAAPRAVDMPLPPGTQYTEVRRATPPPANPRPAVTPPARFAGGVNRIRARMPQINGRNLIIMVLFGIGLIAVFGILAFLIMNQSSSGTTETNQTPFVNNSGQPTPRVNQNLVQPATKNTPAGNSAQPVVSAPTSVPLSGDKSLCKQDDWHCLGGAMKSIDGPIIKKKLESCGKPSSDQDIWNRIIAAGTVYKAETECP